MYYLYTLIDGRLTDILPQSNNLAWSNDKDTLAVELSFDSIYKLDDPSHIVLKNDDVEVFRGILFKRSESKFINKYTCMDYAFYLNKNETIIQFNNVSASDAIKQICTIFGFKSDIVQISTIIDKVYMDQTLSSIIDDILEQSENELGTKFVREMISDVFTIRKLADLVINPKILIGKDLAINSSIENMKNNVSILTNDGILLVHVNDEQGMNKYGLLHEIIVTDNEDIAHAKNIATNYLADNNKVFKDTSLNLIAISGGDDIKANRLISISIPTMGLDGMYRIKSASHTLDNNKHAVSISLEWGV